MARFYGEIGYGLPEETEPGVWEDVIKERKYFGDVLRLNRTLETSDKVNGDITIGNELSIIADAYAFEHFASIKYVIWHGSYWTITRVEVQHPRLRLTLGGVYNGQTFETSPGIG